MSYEEDRRELLKLKQGIKEESESEIKEEEKPPVKEKPRGWKRMANFFYYYKIHLIVGAFFLAIISFLMYDLLSKEKMDIRVILVANDAAVSTSLHYKQLDYETALESYCPDFDENGNVHVETYFIDMTNNSGSAEYALANESKLYCEMSLGYAQILIGNRAMFEKLAGDSKIEDCFLNLSELYPDDENIVDGCFYRVKGSAFADAVKYVEGCPDDLYIVVKGNYEGFTDGNKDEEMYAARSQEVFANIINNAVQNAPAAE